MVFQKLFLRFVFFDLQLDLILDAKDDFWVPDTCAD